MGNDIPARTFAQDPDIADLAIRSAEQKKKQEQDQIAADKEWLDRVDPISDTTPHTEYADVKNLTRNLTIRSVDQKKKQEQDQIAADKEWLDRMDPMSDTTPHTEYADVKNLTRNLTNMHLASNGKNKMDKNTQSRSRSSSPTNTAGTYIAYYCAKIAKDFSSKALAHSPLPANRELLQEVSEYMAEEMYKRYVMGFLALLPPVNHPHYPFWLPEHKGNYAITAMLAMEKVEMEF